MTQRLPNATLQIGILAGLSWGVNIEIHAVVYASRLEAHLHLPLVSEPSGAFRLTAYRFIHRPSNALFPSLR